MTEHRADSELVRLQHDAADEPGVADAGTGDDGEFPKASRDPKPGRLDSLPTDNEDADALVAVIRAWGPRPRQLIRFAVTEGWERLRFPRPLVLRGERLSARWPWSPDARAEHARAVAEARNVVRRLSEHLFPMVLIVE